MIWGYIVLAYLSLFALGISDNIRGPLFPEILKNFAVSETHGAVFFAVSSFCGFIASYSVRFLLRKWSRVRTLQIAIFFMAAGLIGMGTAQEYGWMLFFSGLFGAALGVNGVLQNTLVSIGSLPQKRQQMLSGLHATYGISSLLAPLVVAGLGGWLGTWRFVFIVISVVPLALLAGSLFWKEKSASPAASLKQRLTPPIPQNRQEHLGQVFLALALSFYVLVEVMVSSWMPLYMRRVRGVSLEESSYYLTAFFVCMLVGRLLFAIYHFKWHLRGMLSAFLLLSAASIGLGLIYHPLFLALSGLFMAPFYPLAVVYVSNHYEKNMDTALSYCMTLQAFFTVAMHGLVGFLTEGYGITSALWVGPVGLVIACLLLNCYERVFKKAV